MAQADKPHSTFDNYSAAILADMIGDLDLEVKELEERIKAAKGELAARGIAKAEGSRFIITKVEATRWNLDLAAAKAKLGEAWVTAHSTVSAVVSFRISVNRAALRVAA